MAIVHILTFFWEGIDKVFRKGNFVVRNYGNFSECNSRQEVKLCISTFNCVYSLVSSIILKINEKDPSNQIQKIKSDKNRF